MYGCCYSKPFHHKLQGKIQLVFNFLFDQLYVRNYLTYVTNLITKYNKYSNRCNKFFYIPHHCHIFIKQLEVGTLCTPVQDTLWELDISSLDKLSLSQQQQSRKCEHKDCKPEPAKWQPFGPSFPLMVFFKVRTISFKTTLP